MVNSLENIDKSKVYVDRIEGLDEVVEDVIGDTLTGAVSTITTSDLTANKVLVSDANGKVSASSIAVSDIPTDSNLVHKSGDETIGGTKTFTAQPKFSTGNGIRFETSNADEYYVMRSTGSPAAGCSFLLNNNTSTAAFNVATNKITIGSNTILPNSVTPATSDNSTRIATTAFVKAQGYAADSGVVHTSGNESITGTKTFSSTIYGSINGNAATVTNGVYTNTTQTISATKTFTANQLIQKAKPVLQLKDTSITRGTAPSAVDNSITINGLDSAGKNTWGIYHTWGTDKKAQTQLICYKGTTTDNTWAGIGVGYDASGNAFTSAPTPATSDNSTKIATTAFVKAQGYITSALKLPNYSSASNKSVGTQYTAANNCMVICNGVISTNGDRQTAISYFYINGAKYLKAEHFNVYGNGSAPFSFTVILQKGQTYKMAAEAYNCTAYKYVEIPLTA